jgi:uncharacterized protein with HEPN domain
MQPRDVRKYLFDVKVACDAITAFVTGQTFEEYRRQLLLRSAVERQLITIGEALNRAAKVDKSIETAITDFRSIISFRNIVVHGYDILKDDTVWGVAVGKVPKLRQEVEALLAKLDAAAS